MRSSGESAHGSEYGLIVHALDVSLTSASGPEATPRSASESNETLAIACLELASDREVGRSVFIPSSIAQPINAFEQAATKSHWRLVP